MAFSLVKYYQTIDVAAEGQNLWNPPDQTVLWPTYFTLISSVITSILAAIILWAYYRSTTAADRMDDWRSRVVWLILLVKVVLEITTSSGMYATGAHAPTADGSAQSLWYQTCSATPDQVSLFSFSVNIPQFCTMQACLFFIFCSSQKWGAISALLSVILDVLSVATFVYWFQHWRHKKRMKKYFSLRQDQPVNVVD
jgi:uncharacterized membrane protein YidH (DUF202 family)